MWYVTSKHILSVCSLLQITHRCTQRVTWHVTLKHILSVCPSHHRKRATNYRALLRKMWYVTWKHILSVCPSHHCISLHPASHSTSHHFTSISHCHITALRIIHCLLPTSDHTQTHTHTHTHTHTEEHANATASNTPRPTGWLQIVDWLNYRSLLQNIVSFIGIFCKRDL